MILNLSNVVSTTEHHAVVLFYWHLEIFIEPLERQIKPQKLTILIKYQHLKAERIASYNTKACCVS